MEGRSLTNIRASTGLEPVTSAIPVGCSTNWAMKPHIGSEVNLLSSYLPVKWNDVKYIWNSYLYCGCRWKWRVTIVMITFIYNRSTNMNFIYILKLGWSRTHNHNKVEVVVSAHKAISSRNSRTVKSILHLQWQHIWILSFNHSRFFFFSNYVIISVEPILGKVPMYKFLICLHCDSLKQGKERVNKREVRETSECLSFQAFLSVCFQSWMQVFLYSCRSEIYI